MKRVRIVTIADIARTLGVKPPQARAKLRKAGWKTSHGRYVFTQPGRELDEVKRIISS